MPEPLVCGELFNSDEVDILKLLVGGSSDGEMVRVGEIQVTGSYVRDV